MSNGISTRQNEESNIARLAAQRQLYRDVNRVEILNVILTVAIPIGLSFFQDIFSWAKTTACIVSLVMLGMSFVIDNWQKEKKKIAATIQQEFDIDVFNIEWDRKLYGAHKNLNNVIAAASKKILSDVDEKKSLENWYRPEVDSLPIEEGIAACQRENFSWDAVLRKQYRSLIAVILALIIIVQMAIGINKAEPIQEFLLRILAMSSALKWIIKIIVGINSDLKRMDSIDKSVNSTEKKTIDDLAFIQKDIFENRKIVTKIPDWFYRLFKNNDDVRERRSLEIH